MLDQLCWCTAKYKSLSESFFSLPEEEFSGELSRCSENTWCVCIRALGRIIVIIIRNHLKRNPKYHILDFLCCYFIWQIIWMLPLGIYILYTQCITHSSLPFAHWEMIIYHICIILSALYIDNFDDSVVLFLWSHTNHFKIGFVNSSANITGWSKTTATVVFAYTFILENIEPGQACLALLGQDLFLAT